MSSLSYRYPVQRATHRKFESRDDYVRATVRERVASSIDARLCQAMEVVARMPGSVDLPSHGFPWLTPVVGSGCLELPAGVRFSPAALADAAIAQLEQVELPAAARRDEQTRTAFAARVRQFTEELVRARVARAPQSAVAAGRPPEIDPLATHLIVVAMLLTQFFHLARSTGAHAMSRWDDDVAQLDTERNLPQELLRVEDDIVTPAVRIIAAIQVELRRRPDPNAMSAAVQRLLSRILAGIKPPHGPLRIRIDVLRLVTEVAWHFLIFNTPVYPGWSDLLLHLMLRGGDDAIDDIGRLLARSTAVEELPGLVRDLLDPVTTTSWTSLHRGGGSASDRTRLYDGVAQVLWAQTEALAAEGRATELPPAVAFVTSFDLELEMALSARAAGRSFSVAVPVHLTDRDTRGEVEFCWLLGIVAPVAGPGGLERLQRPGSWRVLTQSTDIEELRARPTVVHLSGCPLLRLPSSLGDAACDAIFADLRALDVDIDRATARIDHAVTVDEYLALRQSEAELFWRSSQRSDVAARHGRALPQAFTQDGSQNRRFWMAMGVPIADAAVRNRVTSQLTARWIGGPAPRSATRPNGTTTPMLGAPPPSGVSNGGATNGGAPHADTANGGGLGEAAGRTVRSDVNGVAVNLRIQEEEVGLLHWLGLDVVEADYREFIADLYHCADHVRERGPAKRPSLAEECTL